MKAVLVDYGAGNLRSVSSAFARAGAGPRSTGDPAAVRETQLAVIAGVGNAESAARRLEAAVLRTSCASASPPGGPCSASASACSCSSRRARRAGGLGVLRGPVDAASGRVSRTWAGTRSGSTAPSALLDGLDGEDVYFAHSFACEPADGVVVAEVEHEGAVVAAVERGAVAGVQFHPERSASPGARVLENAVAWSRSA